MTIRKAISVSGKPSPASEVLTVATKGNVTEPGEHRVFEYGSYRIKWGAVKLIRGAILADRLDVGASADLFLTLIEVYSKSLLVNASLNISITS